MPNLYSEMLAGLTGVPELKLIDEMRNVRCRDCGLVFKNSWPQRFILRQLFTDRVPLHPKGWDVISRRFTPDNFEAEVSAYRLALQQEEVALSKRYRRSLISIIQAIPDYENNQLLSQAINSIMLGDIVSLEKGTPQIRLLIQHPKPYSRFSGFSEPTLWQFIIESLGRINSYAEVGCPLWGLAREAKKNSCNSTYLHRSEPNYWGDECRRNKRHCSTILAGEHEINTAEWQELPKARYDAIGVFQYLDHLERPSHFMSELFERTRAAIIILDQAKEPTAIQHFTGWSLMSMRYLAHQYRCILHSEFTEILPSGNQLFILAQS